MNKSWILAAAAGVVAATLSFGLIRHRAGTQSCGMTGSALCAVPALKEKLGLDAGQATAIALMDRELAARLAGQCRDYCVARAALAAALLEGGPRAVEESRRLIDQMGAIQSASELATLDHVTKVCALLTPAQRKTFLAGLAGCLCGEGGGCGGACMKEVP